MENLLVPEISKRLPGMDPCCALQYNILPALYVNNQVLIFNVAIKSNSNQMVLYFRCVYVFSLLEQCYQVHDVSKKQSYRDRLYTEKAWSQPQNSLLTCIKQRVGLVHLPFYPQPCTRRAIITKLAVFKF